MTQDQVVSIWIGSGSDGLTTVKVVTERPVGRSAEVHRGPAADMRRYARALAAKHDLVPVWPDPAWRAAGARRPLPPVYVQRSRTQVA